MVSCRGQANGAGGYDRKFLLRKDGLSNTLTTVEDNNRVLTDSGLRKLTPVECERLQGFPDGWTAIASDSQRYKMLGNAVTVNVIRDLVDKLI